MVGLQLDLAPVDGVEDILRPGDQQPHHRAALLGNGGNDPLGLHAPEQDRPPPHEEGAEPVHLRPRVIEGRNAEKDVVPGLAVVLLFHHAGVAQAPVAVDDGLGKSRGAGGKVDGRLVVLGQIHLGGPAGTVGNQTRVGLGEGGALLAHVEEGLDPGQLVADVLDPARELRSEKQVIHVGQLQAVLDLLSRVAEIQGHGHGAGFQDPEVDGKPLQTVHEQDGHLVPLVHVAGQQKIGQPVGLAVELRPGHFGTETPRPAGFDESVFSPGRVTFFQFLRIDLHQSHVIAVKLGVPRQNFGDRHCFLP